MKSYFCVIYGTPLIPTYRVPKCSADKGPACIIPLPILLGMDIGATLPALKKMENPRALREGTDKFQYPIVRQPSLVSMCNSTLHYGRHRFNYFILMSLIMALGTFSLLL